MRIIIRLNSENTIKVPFNYNSIITGIIYTTLHDKHYSNHLHEDKGFKYFTISQLYFYKFNIDHTHQQFNVKDGFSFIVSCPDNYFINTLMQGLAEQQYVWLNNQRLTVESIMVEPYFKKDVTTTYYTLSPILVRTKRLIDGKEKVHDLNPSETQFYTQIRELLIKKHNQYHNKEEYTTSDIQVTSQMRNTRGVRIAIKKHDNITYNRSYFMDLTITAPPPLQDFIYDCGVGEKTAMGFGCISRGKTEKEVKKQFQQGV